MPETLHDVVTRGITRGLEDAGADLTGCALSLLSGHVIRELRLAGLHPGARRHPAAQNSPIYAHTAECRNEHCVHPIQCERDGVCPPVPGGDADYARLAEVNEDAANRVFTIAREALAERDKARAEAAQLQAEITRLESGAVDALVDQASFKGMTVEEGAAILELGPPRALVIAWVDAARKMLGDAENYSETRVDFPRESFSMEVKAAGEVDRYVFTVQRAGNLTPHEARERAEKERDVARSELAALIRVAGDVRRYWLDWPSERREAVGELSKFLASAIDRLILQLSTQCPEEPA